MSSLRARVLVSVLALAAAGMVALGAVTYAEQRSFLEDRVDQEARAAVGALAQALDAAGLRPPGSAPGGGGGPGAPGSGGPGPDADDGHNPQVNLPPGTYGQRRDASGHVLGHRLITYSTSETVPPAPKLPAKLALDKLVTVGSVGSSGLHYRAYAEQDREDPGITVVAIPLSDVESTLHRLLLVEALVIAGVLAALGASAWFVVKVGLRPLDRIEVTAGQIAAGDLSRRVSPATQRTEVGRLGLALNAMLDRLEQAFQARMESEERLRRFLADASHELRTPLASVRGYAELFRMGAASDAEDTELAMRRIEEEAKRMGVLVEDLLALARLDAEPDLQREPVDLAALARDAVQDARARAPERDISVNAPEHAVVSGDPLQLRQVFANLLGNAIVHTPAATAIEVSVHEDAQAVSVGVRDHGPGIPEDARERLFERFWRSERGRGRGRAGAGLGLAIAYEIVSAHEGEITARAATGGGAEFVVRIPSRPPPGAAGAAG
jgi:two-component system, OmpR family, sensor kinase